MYLPRAIISSGSSAVMLAEKSLELPVSLTQALMAFTTSGMHSFIWQKTWLPWGSSFLMKSPPCQKE
eukprot:Skav228752  [mRNA]  locus=scaffold1034:6187:6387:+ [translate_table: standard]